MMYLWIEQVLNQVFFIGYLHDGGGRELERAVYLLLQRVIWLEWYLESQLEYGTESGSRRRILG